jgi:endogenous inhibitor of DNA gyrase (YacG/DUF329 family)
MRMGALYPAVPGASNPGARLTPPESLPIIPRVICPICQRETTREGNRFFPFCSERCKLVDLSKWLGGEYRIPGPPVVSPGNRPDDPEES